jgi:hypothetical protein
VTGAVVGYGELVDCVGEGLGEALGLALADAVAVALADLEAVGVAVADPVALPGARAVPLNRLVDVGEMDEPPASGLDPEPVHAVIPTDRTTTAATLAVRMPTQCLFPYPAAGNLDNNYASRIRMGRPR